MKGLELARKYYEEKGRDALARRLPGLKGRLAVGLAGEGSECFGFDDELSRDHDFGPSFCIWMDKEDYIRYNMDVQEVYNSLPGAFAGFAPRNETPEGEGRVGVLCIQTWYRRYTGCPEGPRTLAQWSKIPESFLATATNGEVFDDPLGKFTEIRQHLLEFYPEDIRLKKIASRAAVMAQAGQYNYPRCVKRGEMAAAEIALAEFMKAGMSMVYLLNKRYAPYYKWMHRGMQDLEILPRCRELFGKLAEDADPQDRIQLAERICLLVEAELRREGLSESKDTFMIAHAWEVQSRIVDDRIRSQNIMEERL